jgi:hypothetical protein
MHETFQKVRPGYAGRAKAGSTGGLGGSHTAPRGTVVPARPPTRRTLEWRHNPTISMVREPQRWRYAGRGTGALERLNPEVYLALPNLEA